MITIMLIAMQALPNYADARPVVTNSAIACARAYDDLNRYQSEAYGVITRRGVDYPHGMIEYPDSVRIRHAIDQGVAPFQERLREVALTATPAQCLGLRDQGRANVDRVIREVFGR
jgi:hypothetical protein